MKPNSIIEECVSKLENLVMDIINLSPHLILIDTDFRREFLSVLRAIPNEYSKAIRDLLLEACKKVLRKLRVRSVYIFSQ